MYRLGRPWNLVEPFKPASVTPDGQLDGLMSCGRTDCPIRTVPVSPVRRLYQLGTFPSRMEPFFGLFGPSSPACPCAGVSLMRPEISH